MKAAALTLLWLAVVLAAVAAARLGQMDRPGQALAAIVVLSILAAVALTLVPRVRRLAFAGLPDRRAAALLVVPALAALLPLVAGVRIPETPLWFLALGYILTGFAEETWFRGLVLETLLPRGSLAAVSWSAVLFGLVHLANLLTRDGTALVFAQAIGAACFGLGYGAIRLATGRLWPLMLLHAATDMALQFGRLPLVPVAVAQDIVLLGFGLWLLRKPRDHAPV